MEEPKRKRLSLDEIDAMLDEIARDSDAGPDRFRAIRMLKSESATTVALPEPLTEGDIVDRLIRVMRPAGKDLAHVAYHRAFRTHVNMRHLLEEPPKNYDAEIGLSLEERDFARNVKSLKRFNKAFPEFKRPGTPPRYPIGRGRALQEEWIYRETCKILLDRKRKIAEEIRAQELKDQPKPEEPPDAAPQ